MRKTSSLRPGSPPVRKTGLKRTAVGRPHCPTAKSYPAVRRFVDGDARARKARRAQIQRMERFGSYAMLIRVLPCCSCYPLLYKGETRLRQTVREFSAYMLGKRRLSEPAHLKSVGAGGLAAGNLLPLCAGCHRLGDYALHYIPPSAFATRIGLPLAITAEAIAATPQGKALLSIDARVVKALRDLTVEAIAPNAWRVTGGTNPAGYTVNLNPRLPRCACKFSQNNPETCKHAIAVTLHSGAKLDTVLRTLVAEELHA